MVGDVNKESLKDIWNGEQLKQFRVMHLNGRKDEIKPCRNCHYLKGFPDHLYLDDKIEALKKIYI